MIKETTSNIKILFNKIKQIEIRCFLSNDNDTFDSYLEFHAGAGGTESQDWADMLRRMYMKWATKKNFKIEIWGTGKPRREFMYSEDMADACVFIMERINFNEIIGMY